MSFDNLSKNEIKAMVDGNWKILGTTETGFSFNLSDANYENLHAVVTGKASRKVGRQGYALILFKDFRGRWHFYIESQNGSVVADSSGSYSRRWDATRAAKRLMGANLAHIYVEDDLGNRAVV